MELYDNVHVNVFYSYDLYIPLDRYNEEGLLVVPLRYTADDGVGTRLSISVVPQCTDDDMIKYKVSFTEKISRPDLIVGHGEGDVAVDAEGKVFVNGVENGRLRDGRTLSYEPFEYIDLIRIKR